MDVVVRTTPEVTEALAHRQPVVALESTLLAHGMPPQRRLEVAQALDHAVRAHGAIPAVVAVCDGQMRAGLEPEVLQRLCQQPNVSKCAQRDLAVALAGGGMHATTVSSTMEVAARAGIAVFATGGIGGVHRGAVDTFDESQDLTALASQPVAVVSAGAKAILDLPRTLERLETLGVLVMGWRCHAFPAFYTADSGLPLEHHTDDMALLASVVHHRIYGLCQGGMLVCNPVPAQHALPVDTVNQAIAQALAQANAQGIRGKALTPFLLGALERLTGGSSVETNVALAVNNAQVAAQLAAALADLEA